MSEHLFVKIIQPYMKAILSIDKRTQLLGKFSPLRCIEIVKDDETWESFYPS